MSDRHVMSGGHLKFMKNLVKNDNSIIITNKYLQLAEKTRMVRLPDKRWRSASVTFVSGTNTAGNNICLTQCGLHFAGLHRPSFKVTGVFVCLKNGFKIKLVLMSEPQSALLLRKQLAGLLN